MDHSPGDHDDPFCGFTEHIDSTQHTRLGFPTPGLNPDSYVDRDVEISVS